MLAPIARLASQLLSAPFAALTLVDDRTVRILASHGAALDPVPRSVSFCDRCVSTGRTSIIEDAATDGRLRSNPWVLHQGAGHYAGVPLISSTGESIGTLCVFGPGPRSFTDSDIESLSDLAGTAMQLLHQQRLLDAYAAQRDQCVGIVEASMDGVLILEALRDPQGAIIDFVFTMVNAQAERLIGSSAEAMLGSRLVDEFPASRSAGLLDRYTRVIETGEPLRDEIFFRDRDLCAWFDFSAVRIHDSVAVTFRNIDDRKRAEAELALTNDRFALASAATQDIIWDLDLRGGHLWWSENITTCLGHAIDPTRETLQWWESLIHPDDRETFASSFTQSITSDRSTWSAEYRIRRADGSYATVLDRAFIIRDDEGNAARAVGAIIDLTARLCADAEIVFQQSLFKAKAEASQDAILVTDGAHRCVQSNSRFRDLVGSSLDSGSSLDAISAVYADCTNPEEVHRHVRAVLDDSLLTIRQEVEFRDGRALELHSEPLQRDTGEFLGRVWFVRDLTRDRQANQFHRAHNLVLEASGVVLFRWLAQPGWPVALVSKSVEQFGYTAEQLLAGDPLYTEIVHPDDLERVAAEVAEHITAGHDSFEQEYRILCADGAVRWIYDKTVVDRDSDGRLLSLQGVVLDVTRHREVERELAASEAMLKELTSQIPGAVYQFRLDPDGSTHIQYISEGITEVCAVTPTQLCADPSLLHTRILPEDIEHFFQSTARSAATLEPWTCEFRYRHPAGDIRWLGANAIPRLQNDGSILWHGLITDITARKNAQEELRRATILLERTNAIAHVGGWEFDLESRHLYLSSEIRRILGIAADLPLPLEKAIEFYKPRYRDTLTRHISRAIEHGEPYDLELEIITASGASRWVRAQCEAVRNRSETVKLRGTLHDIHEQYLAKQELARRAAELERLRDAAEAASRAKSEFIANMSHEIRTPLTAILGFADMLRADDGLRAKPIEHNQALDTIAAAGQHLLTIINDILDISRIEAGRMLISPVETDLPRLIQDAIQLLSARAASKGITLEAVLSSPIPRHIEIDPTRLRQMLLNLVGNAVKFTDEGSVSVAISADTQNPATLTIDIKDTGPGLTEADSARLFTPFSQADSSLQRRHGGTGLGLAISRRCAQLMGGGVELVRSEPGRGSCFRITLPIKPVDGAEMIDSLAGRSPHAGPARDPEPTLRAKILFAEDGAANQRLIAFHLQRAGATVDIADNGRIALDLFDRAKANNQPYDLLLTDIQMPEMDGLELTTHLRSAGEIIPIVAVTAHAMAEDRDRCLRAGCNDYTTKPIDPAHLIATCRALIAGPGDDQTNKAA